MQSRSNSGHDVLGEPVVFSSDPFPVCIDDSDCQNFAGAGSFACFDFICYPWQDDRVVDSKDRIPLCRKDKDCAHNKKCLRHHDKRRISQGLCLAEAKSCSEVGKDCEEGYHCCGGTCCNGRYFRKYTQLPCMTDDFCQDLGLGKFCCPPSSIEGYKMCCNNDNSSKKDVTIAPKTYKGITIP